MFIIKDLFISVKFAIFLKSSSRIFLFYFLSNSISLFIFGCAGSLLLCSLFSRGSEQGLLYSCGAWTSCVGFSCCGAGALECKGFSTCGTWAQ